MTLTFCNSVYNDCRGHARPNWASWRVKALFATVSFLLTTAAVFAVSVAHAQAAGQPETDAIRAKLLATPVWTFEMSHEVHNQIFVNTGQVRFEQQGDKLISKLNLGFQCEEEVELLPDALVMSDCAVMRTMKFNPADSHSPFKGVTGSYTYIVRPASP